MSERTFRLLEHHQKIDERLRCEQSRRIPDPFVITRLTQMKRQLRATLASLVRLPVPAR